MAEPDAARPAAGLPGDAPRLPLLRRPAGWRAMDEAALRRHATDLYLAQWPQPLAAAPALPAAHHGLADAFPPPQAAAEPVALAEPTPAALGRVAPGGPSVRSATSAPADVLASVPAAALRGRRGHWHLLPWVLFGLLALLMTPWLIWAPVVGGFCLGLLLLQGGLWRRWQSQRVDPAGGTDADADTGGPAPARRGLAREEPGAVAAVQAVGPARLRFAHGGWTLGAGLILAAVQAAMLFTTLELKNREPAAVASAMRAAQAGGAARPAARRGQPADGSAAPAGDEAADEAPLAAGLVSGPAPADTDPQAPSRRAP